VVQVLFLKRAFETIFFSSSKDYVAKEFFWRNGPMVVVA